MKSNLHLIVILFALVNCFSLLAGTAEKTAGTTKEKIALDRWTYIHADDSREPAAKGKAGDFGISFGDSTTTAIRTLLRGTTSIAIRAAT